MCRTVNLFNEIQRVATLVEETKSGHIDILNEIKHLDVENLVPNVVVA